MTTIEEAIEAVWQESRGERKYDPGYPVKASSNFADGFKAGAKWALSHQWVSVEKVVPPFDGRIILCRDTYWCALCIWNNDRFIDMSNNEEFVATHWMPIPPLPEARKEEVE